MKVRDSSPGSRSFCSGGGIGLERLAGRVVLGLLRDGVPLSRKNLSARVAALLELNISAEERQGYEYLLRLILES